MLENMALAFVLALSLLLLSLLHHRRKSKTSSSQSTEDAAEKAALGLPARTPARWEPVDWKFPAVTPRADFSLTDTPPPDFRPFQRYHRHIIISKPLDLDDWVILDNEFPRYHALRTARNSERGPQICGNLPEASEAALELCQELCEYLSRRYPTVYRVTRKHNTLGWDGEGEISTIAIPALGATYDLQKQDPLEIAGLIQPADVNILTKREDGKYYLTGVMFGLGGGQRVQGRLDVDLSSLHTNGRVPKYDSQLRKPLEHFLSKLKVDAPITRNTATFGIHDELCWPTISMGPEDDYDAAHGGPRPGTPSHGVWQPPAPISDPEAVFMRQERQTLRRLPRTGAVVWLVHTYARPAREIVHEPGVPGRIAAFLRSWDPALARHKGLHLYADCFLPYLDALHKRQVAQGVCDEDEPAKI